MPTAAADRRPNCPAGATGPWRKKTTDPAQSSQTVVAEKAPDLELTLAPNCSDAIFGGNGGLVRFSRDPDVAATLQKRSRSWGRSLKDSRGRILLNASWTRVRLRFLRGFRGVEGTGAR